MQPRHPAILDHFWIIVGRVNHDGTRQILFIASCTDGPLGRYPIFIFTPIDYHHLFADNLVPALKLLVDNLYGAVVSSRVYSIFGPEVVARRVSSLWTQRTNIQELPEPYYHAKISYLNQHTFKSAAMPAPQREDELIQLRLATQDDILAIAELAYMFAAESPPFVLSQAQAKAEAAMLVNKEQVWVYGVWKRGHAPRIASIVAFTRNTQTMATITKVYTHPEFRGQRRAEQLVRKVCDFLLTEAHKTVITLFVGLENKAARVYHRVGFVGLDQDAPPVYGVDPWIEIGFDRAHVALGHW